MLSRTASNIFWLARYLERMENLARIIGVSERMAMMPGETEREVETQWESALIISGCEPQFLESGCAVEREAVIDFLVRDPDNPASLYSSIQAARVNGRSVRTVITMEMWESLNSTWLEFDDRWDECKSDHDIRPFLEWIKERTASFRGAMGGTMVRDQAWRFAQIGTHIERADNTARILDVKYHVLLPEDSGVGGSVDYFQWITILRGVAALGSYSYLYRDQPKPWKIAELLILRPEMPRSLIYCMGQIQDRLFELQDELGDKTACHRYAGKLCSELQYADAAEIFQNGLHEWLTRFIERNDKLSEEIRNCYMMVPA